VKLVSPELSLPYSAAIQAANNLKNRACKADSECVLYGIQHYGYDQGKRVCSWSIDGLQGLLFYLPNSVARFPNSDTSYRYWLSYESAPTYIADCSDDSLAKLAGELGPNSTLVLIGFDSRELDPQRWTYFSAIRSDETMALPRT
jgi:hypothetical protein